jgi:hypothetical protein
MEMFIASDNNGIRNISFFRSANSGENLADWYEICGSWHQSILYAEDSIKMNYADINIECMLTALLVSHLVNFVRRWDYYSDLPMLEIRYPIAQADRWKLTIYARSSGGVKHLFLDGDREVNVAENGHPKIYTTTMMPPFTPPPGIPVLAVNTPLAPSNNATLLTMPPGIGDAAASVQRALDRLVAVGRLAAALEKLKKMAS